MHDTNAHCSRLLWSSLTCAALMVFSQAAGATPVNGTLQLNGVLTFNAVSINFCSTGSSCPAAPGNWIVPGSGTGDLAAPYANNPAGGLITNLSNANAPVGTLLPGNGIVLLTFTPSATLPVPDIQFYFTKLLAGTGGTGSCGAAPAPGQTCTPVGSAFTFTNNAGGTSSATINMQGKARRVSTNEFDNLQAVASAQLPFTFQVVLSVLGGGGSVTTSYSGTYTASGASPLLQGAVSRKVHGVASTFDLPLAP